MLDDSPTAGRTASAVGWLRTFTTVSAPSDEAEHRGLRPGGDRGQAPVPMGQLTPVPAMPQYPFGFFARYCWWYGSA